MKFADENAEDKFVKLSEKYGLQHINSHVEITVESLEKLEASLKKCYEDYSKEEV